MEVLMAIFVGAALALLLVAVAQHGVDSRPADADRPTHWWPGTPRS
jgi:hypothetical protein